MAGGLLVAREDEPEPGLLVDRMVDGQNRASWNAEHVFDSQILQRAYQRLRAGHLLSVGDGALVLIPGGFAHAAERLQGCR